jgi:hypothetical protein
VNPDEALHIFVGALRVGLFGAIGGAIGLAFVARAVSLRERLRQFVFIWLGVAVFETIRHLLERL